MTEEKKKKVKIITMKEWMSTTRAQREAISEKHGIILRTKKTRRSKETVQGEYEWDLYSNAVIHYNIEERKDISKSIESKDSLLMWLLEASYPPHIVEAVRKVRPFLMKDARLRRLVAQTDKEIKETVEWIWRC